MRDMPIFGASEALIAGSQVLRTGDVLPGRRESVRPVQWSAAVSGGYSTDKRSVRSWQ